MGIGAEERRSRGGTPPRSVTHTPGIRAGGWQKSPLEGFGRGLYPPIATKEILRLSLIHTKDPRHNVARWLWSAYVRRWPTSEGAGTSVSISKLYTTGDMADLLSVNRKAVYDLKYRGELPPEIRIGNKVFWRESDIEAWLQSNQVTKEMT